MISIGPAGTFAGPRATAPAHKYSTRITYQSMKGRFPALRGELYEGDVLIANFRRRATKNGCVPPIEYKFRSEAARNRFDNFADSCYIEEAIEALI